MFSTFVYERYLVMEEVVLRESHAVTLYIVHWPEAREVCGLNTVLQVLNGSSSHRRSR